ncbi:MAG: archease [Elusimicrobiota bacterium]
MKRKYKSIEHTADVGIIACGRTISQLLENAAEGMYSFLADIKKIKPSIKKNVSVKGIDNESLLVNWLNELLYLTSTKRIIFSKFKVIKSGSFFAEGKAYGEEIKTAPDTEIKAATYSGLKIIKTRAGYKARIIFDV